MAYGIKILPATQKKKKQKKMEIQNKVKKNMEKNFFFRQSKRKTEKFINCCSSRKNFNFICVNQRKINNKKKKTKVGKKHAYKIQTIYGRV